MSASHRNLYARYIGGWYPGTANFAGSHWLHLALGSPCLHKGGGGHGGGGGGMHGAVPWAAMAGFRVEDFMEAVAPGAAVVFAAVADSRRI